MSIGDLREGLAERFHSLRHRNFRLYWVGQLVSLVGTWMQSVAQGWLMHRLTPSAFMLGLLGFCQFIPVLLFSLWAGVVVDHVDKRRLLYWTQGGALVQAALFAALTGFGVIQVWMVLALAMGFGVINAFDLPARQSFLVELVGKEDLSNAIALNSAAFNVARILGPAVAGGLLAAIGESGCFWLNAVSYVAVLVSLTRMTLPPRAGAVPHRMRSTMREGLRYAWGVVSIRNLLVLLALTAGIGFQYQTLLPVYASDILHQGAGAYALLVSAFGVGALAGAVRLTQKLDRWGLRANLLAGLASAGLGLFVLAWSRVLWLSMVGGVFAGFGLIVYVASTNTLLQLTTDDRYRGRVMSLYTLMFIGTTPFGALLAGWIAQRWGAPIATSLSGTAMVLGAVW
ncbi:MAG TPA: MFS transporter, partial [Candidatus Eisenbacteria bacterium]|nr:MFS transporter [Candidatus Eisenbacteria bacterium]